MDNCIGFAESVDQVVPPTQGAHFVGQFCQAAAEEAADMPARTCDRDWAAEKRTHLTPPPQLPSSWKPSSASCRIVDVDARPPGPARAAPRGELVATRRPPLRDLLVVC